MAAGWAPFYLWPLCWLSSVGMAWLFLQEPAELRARKLARLAWVYGFFVTVFGFYWLAYTFREFGALPWPLAVGVALFICALAGVQPALYAWLWTKVSARVPTKFRAVAVVLFLIVWDALELRVFPWSPVHALGQDKHILPSVYYLGTWGWRLVYFSTAVFAATAIPKWRKPALALLALTVVGYGLGWHAKRTLSARYSARMPVALLQGNIGNYQKKQSKLGIIPTIHNVVKVHDDLIQQVAAHNKTTQKTHWVFWPETSLPGFPLAQDFNSYELKEQLKSWARLTKSPHFVGTYESNYADFYGERKSLDYNIVTLFEEGGYVSHYRKHIRIPFGEYIPGDQWWPRSYHYLPAVNHFGRGEEFTTLTPTAPNSPVFLPLVCYEAIVESFINAFVRDAKTKNVGKTLVLLNPSNDSWYGPTSEPRQHSLLMRWQVARVGLPALRPTNTGYSQVIAPWGEVLAEGPRDETTVIYGELPIQP